MDKTNPLAKKSIISRFQSQLTFWRVDALLLVIGTILILLLIFFLINTWNSNRPKIQYTPDDIVYQNPVQAIHEMDSTVSAPDPVFPLSTGAPAPQLVVSERYYDFGMVATPKILDRVFILANRGQGTLLIRRAYTTCGCTVADFTATEIPPGKVALMTLHFDTGYHDLRGTTVRRGVIFETNDPSQPQEEIWIQATVK